MFSVSPEPTTHEDQAALRSAASRPAALCTLVGIDGSFSRRLGAQIAFAPDGTQWGDLADGCLENELRLQASQIEQPTVLRYGRGSPFIDFKLPCGSGLDILIDPAPDRNALAGVVSLLDERTPARLSLPSGGTPNLATRGYIPRLRIVALGASAEVDNLAQLAKAYGVDLAAITQGRGLGSDALPSVPIDPWTAVVLLFHDHEWERQVLDWVLTSDAFYIGAIGGRTARAERLDYLNSRGWPAAQIDRVRSPIGLIARTRDARALALSVLAEIAACYDDLRSTAG